MSDPGRPRERAFRPAELSLPAVGECERIGLARVVGGQAGKGAQPLALGRRRLDRPGQPRKRPPRRVQAHGVRLEELADRLPERACLARGALVRGGLAYEREQLPRAGAGGVEQVAVAARRVGPLESGAPRSVQVAALLVVEERRRGRASRQRPLLEPDHEDGVEPPRAGAGEVEDGHPAGLAGGVSPHRRPVERRQ